MALIYVQLSLSESHVTCLFTSSGVLIIKLLWLGSRLRSQFRCKLCARSVDDASEASTIHFISLFNLLFLSQVELPRVCR